MTDKELLEEGTKYLTGDGVEMDKLKAFDLFKQASDLGNFYATYNAACMYYFGDGVEQNYNEALKLYILGANQGDKEAANHAGMLAYEMNNSELGLKYLKLSAEMKSVGGEYNYGMAIIDNNPTEGLKWINLAASHKNGYALLTLGDFSMEGKYLDKDIIQGFKYYKASADLRVNEAEKKVSDCYKEGIGTSVDLEASEYYLKMSTIPYED